MSNTYFVNDVSRQQAGDLWHVAEQSTDPYSNWVARAARSLYEELDIDDRGRIRLDGNQTYHRARKLVEAHASGIGYVNRPELAQSWEDMLDRVLNAQVVP